MMTIKNDINSADNPDVEQIEKGDQTVEFDDMSFDNYASYEYINPEFFSPKEISTLTMSMSIQMLPLIVRRRKVTIDDLKTATYLAAIIITLSIDDSSQRQSFAKATTTAGLQADVLLEARRRLGEAIGDSEELDETTS